MTYVVAGAVFAADGRVLIAQRPPGKQLAGHWEFPGGKLETGEMPAHALARELREELSIIIRDPRPLMRVRHTYDFGEVLLDLWVVNQYGGEPRGMDGQRLRWCTLNELGAAELLIVDRLLIKALRLPERLTEIASVDYCVGDSPGTPREMLQGVFCEGLEDGIAAARDTADFLVMRSAVARDELAELCTAVGLPVFAVGLSLPEAWKLGATGVSHIEI